jgi:dTDP-glucose 4,6-dehydratase
VRGGVTRTDGFRRRAGRPMKIVVTGGAGFIGANFLNLFVPRHPEHRFINVDALTYAANLASLAPIENRPNYAMQCIDIADAAAVDELFAREAPDRVVHFAAESHVDRSIVDPGACIRTNVAGTYTLLEAFRKNTRSACALFHHVSTDEVYGSLGADGSFTESSRYDPSSPYSATKAASDHLVRAYARTFGLPTMVTNCSNNYGPLQFPEKLIPLTILNAIDRRPLPVYGQGLNVRDWLFVEDHCEAIWTVMERAPTGTTYNIGGNHEVRNIDVVNGVCRMVAEETGAHLSELTDLITFVADRPGHDLRYAIDASKLKRELGWAPRESFDSGLRRTVLWYLDNPSWVEDVRSGGYHQWLDTNYGARG